MSSSSRRQRPLKRPSSTPASVGTFPGISRTHPSALWSISVNGSDPDKQDKIMPIVTDVLRRMVQDGLDKTLLTGALNRTEFTLREADFAGRPKGLIYAIRCMDTWLYDLDPLEALSYEKSLDVLRKGIDNGYFEDLIRRYILDNAYYALVSLVPEPGLTEKHDKALAEKLAAYKASLTKEEIDAIVAESEALKQRQATPDTPEAWNRFRPYPAMILKRKSIRWSCMKNSSAM